MNKILITASLAAVVAISSSCSGDKKEALNLAGQVAGCAATNQVDKLKEIYPQADFDSIGFRLKVEPTAIKVAETDGDDPLRINLGQAGWLEFGKDDSGRLVVINSKGLLALPDWQMTMLEEAGAVDDNTTDLKIKRMLDDKKFIEYLDNQANKSYDTFLAYELGKNSKKLDAQGYQKELYQPIKITNNSHLTLNPEDYEVYYGLRTIGSKDTPAATIKATSIALQPGETGEVTITATGYVEVANVKFVPKISKDDYMARHGYKPTGSEFEYFKKAE